MKKFQLFGGVVVATLLLLIPFGRVQGQEKEVHIRIVKEGEQIKDTSFVVGDEVSEDDLSGMINRITGEKNGLEEETHAHKVKVWVSGDDLPGEKKEFVVISGTDEPCEKKTEKKVIVHSGNNKTVVEKGEVNDSLHQKVKKYVYAFSGDEEAGDSVFVVHSGGNKIIVIRDEGSSDDDKDVKVKIISGDDNSGIIIVKDNEEEETEGQEVEVTVTVKGDKSESKEIKKVKQKKRKK